MIKFRFIRTDTTEQDDVCTITKKGDMFKLRFQYATANGYTHNKLVCTDIAVHRWVRRALDLLERDIDPFARVQLECPLLPAILFNVCDLSENYHAILDAVEFSLDNWPAKAKNNTLDEGIYGDENYDEDIVMEESEPYTGDYSEMPPLISYNYTASNNHHLFLD